MVGVLFFRGAVVRGPASVVRLFCRVCCCVFCERPCAGLPARCPRCTRINGTHPLGRGLSKSNCMGASGRANGLGCNQDAVSRIVFPRRTQACAALMNLRGVAEKVFQHRVYSAGDNILNQVLGVKTVDSPCYI